MIEPIPSARVRHREVRCPTIWKIYDKQLIYFYRYDTGTCRKTSSQEALVSYFGDLADSTFEGQTGVAEPLFLAWVDNLGLPGNIWTYQLSRGNSLEFGTGGTSQLPLYVTRFAPGRITRLQFIVFSSGQPDARVFSLPAACVE